MSDTSPEVTPTNVEPTPCEAPDAPSHQEVPLGRANLLRAAVIDILRGGPMRIPELYAEVLKRGHKMNVRNLYSILYRHREFETREKGVWELSIQHLPTLRPSTCPAAVAALKNGPLPLKDIHREVLAAGAVVTEASLGAILRGYKEFVCVGPKVYGLAGRDDSAAIPVKRLARPTIRSTIKKVLLGGPTSFESICREVQEVCAKTTRDGIAPALSKAFHRVERATWNLTEELKAVA